MKVMVKNMGISALLLGLFAIVGTTLVAMTEGATAPLIKENERQELLENLQVVLNPSLYDNAIEESKIEFSAEMGSSADPLTIYRGYSGKIPVAAVIRTATNSGYNGSITLLIAISFQGAIQGVRVITHKETPGLGDKIESERSDWILSFNDRSLNNTSTAEWKVKKDGGHFDQFTGATITPRAIVAEVHKTLTMFQRKRDQIFSLPNTHLNLGDSQ